MRIRPSIITSIALLFTLGLVGCGGNGDGDGDGQAPSAGNVLRFSAIPDMNDRANREVSKTR